MRFQSRPRYKYSKKDFVFWLWCLIFVWLCCLILIAILRPELVSSTYAPVKSYQKINDTVGNFSDLLHDNDSFGTSVANLGDLDGDNICDLAVGVASCNDGGPDRGAVWILFLNTDGTVKSHKKISDTAGNFNGVLDNNSFGSSVASLGDLNNDGVLDLVVGAERDSDAGLSRGAIWILFLASPPRSNTPWWQR
jgi:hypothetical protein